MAKPSVQLNFRLPVELSDALEAYCRQTGITKTEVIEEALKQYLAQRDNA